MSWKLSVLVFCLLFMTGSMASAQTMSLAVLDGGTYTRSFDVVIGDPFTVVTLLDTNGHEAAAAEWVQTELLLTSPGVFRLDNVRSCEFCLAIDLPTYNGEWIVPFGTCIPPAEELQILQVSYGDFAGAIAGDEVLTIRGFQPGDTRPSSFGGSPGFVDCANTLIPASMAGGDAWETGSGEIVPSGALVLNPTPPLVVDAEAHGFSRLKARFE